MTSKIFFAVAIGLVSCLPCNSHADEMAKLDKLNSNLFGSSAVRFCQHTMGYQAADVSDACCAATGQCGGQLIDNPDCSAPIKQCELVNNDSAQFESSLTD
jgi:hypothetical protein